jgi:hypothetical protein
MEQDGAYKNKPVGYFSERASLSKGYFSLQSKKGSHKKSWGEVIQFAKKANGFFDILLAFTKRAFIHPLLTLLSTA